MQVRFRPRCRLKLTQLLLDQLDEFGIQFLSLVFNFKLFATFHKGTILPIKLLFVIYGSKSPYCVWVLVIIKKCVYHVVIINRGIGFMVCMGMSLSLFWFYNKNSKKCNDLKIYNLLFWALILWWLRLWLLTKQWTGNVKKI